MSELISEAFRLVNFPFTVLIILVTLYWLLVMFGMVTGDHGVDAHGEVGHDLDSGLDTDVDSDLDAEHHVEGHHHGHHDGGSLWSSALKFVNLGEVPVMVVLSVLVLSSWTFSMVANHYWTGGSSLLALAFLGVNFVVTIFITRYVTMPLKPLFRAINKQYDKPVEIVGTHCKILTTEANGEFGQAEIATGGAPLLINVRVLNDETLRRGDLAVVVREDKENRIFYITANPLPTTNQ